MVDAHALLHKRVCVFVTGMTIHYPRVYNTTVNSHHGILYGHARNSVLLEWDHRGLGLGTTHRLGGRRRWETLRLSKVPKSRKVFRLKGSSELKAR